jgi:hypothetical protein
MLVKRIAALSLAVLLAAAFAAPAPVGAQERLDHRDDFRMNSISGGDFRAYISDHIHEDDRWGHAMRMFGTFHNHMHEMMTDLALYGAERLGDGHRIPDFDNRISGGEWGDYRKSLEADGVESAWRDFVQITQIMHDRVHHAMYKSVVYDRASRGRDADLDDYIGAGRAPYASEETVLRTDQVSTEHVPMDRFRNFVWHHGFEDRHFHAAMQAMMVFDEMLYTLMTDWAAYGAQKADIACRPPEFGARITRAGWHAYAEGVQACGEVEWRHLVQVVALMHDRIHHMMYRVMLHDAAAHDRAEEVGELLSREG